MIALRTHDPQEALLAGRLARAEGEVQACAALGDVAGAFAARAKVARAARKLNEHLDRKDMENG